jgi:hypothetical protein
LGFGKERREQSTGALDVRVGSLGDCQEKKLVSCSFAYITAKLSHFMEQPLTRDEMLSRCFYLILCCILLEYLVLSNLPFMKSP